MCSTYGVNRPEVLGMTTNLPVKVAVEPRTDLHVSRTESPRNISPWLLFLIPAAVAYVSLCDYLLVSRGEPRYLLMEMFAGATIVLVPMSVLFAKERLQESHLRLGDLFFPPDMSMDSWLNRERQGIFRLGPFLLGSVAIVVLLGVYTLGWSDIIYQSEANRWIAIAGSIPILVLCGFAGYFVGALLSLLWRLYRLPLRLKFPRSYVAQTQFLSQYGNLLTLSVAVMYALMYTAAAFGPLGTDGIPGVALAILSGYPFATFIFGVLSTSALKREIRSFQLRTMDEYLAHLWQVRLSANGPIHEESFVHGLEIRMKLGQGSRPSIDTLVGFIAAILPLVSQLLLH
jgi:hypothetical protein